MEINIEEWRRMSKVMVHNFSGPLSFRVNGPLSEGCMAQFDLSEFLVEEKDGTYLIINYTLADFGKRRIGKELIDNVDERGVAMKVAYTAAREKGLKLSDLYGIRYSEELIQRLEKDE
jgi:hypothetical protein